MAGGITLGISIGVTALSGGAGWVPSQLTPIAWYDPSDLTTMFQDAAGTTPVTADGHPVGLMMDKSGNGYHLAQSSAGRRPLYKTSGGQSWLLFDGVDDQLTASTSVTLPTSHEITVAGLSSSAAGVTSAFLSLANAAIQVNGTEADLEAAVYSNSATVRRVRTRYAGGVDTSPSGPDVGIGTFVFAQSHESATSLKQYDFGVQNVATITTATTIGSNKFFRIGPHTSTTQYLTGRVYGIIVTAALATVDRALLTTWIGARAGLALSSALFVLRDASNLVLRNGNQLIT